MEEHTPPEGLNAGLASASARLPKRRRVDVACNACRQRKSRCDGVRPVCSACSRLSLQCMFEQITPPESGKTAEKRPTYEELSRKVKELEARLNSRATTGSHAIDTPAPSATEEHVERLPVEDEATVDELATQVFNELPERNIGYFGAASNHAFVRTLSAAFAYQIPLMVQSQQHVSRNPGQYHSNSSFRSPSPSPEQTRRRRDAHRIVEPFVVPQEQELVELLNHFFITTGAVLPFVEKSAFLPLTKDAVWRTTRSGRALLNIICAHASLTVNPTNAEDFYDRAVVLLEAYTLHGASLELIQALLLLCSFQQNTQRSTISWTYHALAVKTAIQQGLHAPSSYEVHGAQMRELRKRLWFGVINQDRLLSTSFGRPCLIPAEHVQVMAPTHEALAMEQMPSFSKHHHEGLLYFNFLTSLQAFRYEALVKIYDYNISMKSSTDAKELAVSRLKLICELETWRSNCALHFDLPSSNEVQTWSSQLCNSNRFRILLMIQLHAVTMLINGPFLLNCLQTWEAEAKLTPKSNPLLGALVQMLEQDIEAASELLKVVSHLVNHAPKFMLSNAAWWICNFNAFTASLHLFGTMLILYRVSFSAHITSIDTSMVRKTLEFGLEVLGAVGQQSLMSLRGRHALHKFLHVFDSLTSTTEQHAEHSNLQSNVKTSSAPTELGFDEYYAQLVSQSTADYFSMPHANGMDFMNADFGLNIFNFG
ncbi:uncharacterized protein PV09_04668 [Verruconis gallopava]|uniref:Zn(2)-C6 fungal-type domain-containing protein n=1 Tax=Verruconis gallopava TaxID=253628 RepID=A0A0D2AYZ7_9PEZI|nr:uncharacterized protein PV09_04668 [Verruconis gallopava]KIW04384.1 hypothetical protein PV09_04668 [Verruconis gallopava]